MACIRWLIRRDLDSVVAIDKQCFVDSWDDSYWTKVLMERNVIALVLEVDDEIRGYVCYELEKSNIRILNMAVTVEWWGNGYGRKMIEKLKSKLTGQRRTTISVTLNERSVGASKFFSRMGFSCVEILKKHFGDNDGYKFRYDLLATQES